MLKILKIDFAAMRKLAGVMPKYLCFLLLAMTMPFAMNACADTTLVVNGNSADSQKDIDKDQAETQAKKYYADPNSYNAKAYLDALGPMGSKSEMANVNRYQMDIQEKMENWKEKNPVPKDPTVGHVAYLINENGRLERDVITTGSTQELADYYSHLTNLYRNALDAVHRSSLNHYDDYLEGQMLSSKSKRDEVLRMIAKKKDSATRNYGSNSQPDSTEKGLSNADKDALHSLGEAIGQAIGSRRR